MSYGVLMQSLVFLRFISYLPILFYIQKIIIDYSYRKIYRSKNPDSKILPEIQKIIVKNLVAIKKIRKLTGLFLMLNLFNDLKYSKLSRI